MSVLDSPRWVLYSRAMDREQMRRDRLKELSAILADHAEDTMDSDDVDQVRAEIIELFDAEHAALEQAERERDEARNSLPDDVCDDLSRLHVANIKLEARLAAVPALVEALRLAADLLCEEGYDGDPDYVQEWGTISEALTAYEQAQKP